MLQIASGMLITVIVDQAKHAVSALQTGLRCTSRCVFVYGLSLSRRQTDGRTVVATEYRKVLGLYVIRFESLDMVFGEYKMDKFNYVYLQKENGYEKC